MAGAVAALEQGGADAQRGIECPRCGCRDLRVYNTRRVGRVVRRIRVCRHCGRRVITTEKAYGDNGG